MISKTIFSFRDNFREKTANPFLGTYIIVWLLRNWELAYSLFNFDAKFTLNDKVQFVKEYYSSCSFIEGVLWNILITFLVLLITYFVLNLSRFIVNASEKQVKPWVYKITDSKSIILKPRFDRLLAERDELLNQLEAEKDARAKLEKENSLLTDQIQSYNMDGDVSSNEVWEIVDILKREDLLMTYSKLSLSILKSQFIDVNQKAYDLFFSLKLLRVVDNNKSNSSWKKVEFSRLGDKVLEAVNIELERLI